MTSQADGQIVTFYSYKGGSGRTMALANIAWILAANSRRVLVVDWDLDAPGLPRFFRPFLDDALVAKTPGVLNLIKRFAFESSTTQEHEPRHDTWYDSFAQLDGHTVPVSWDFEGGSLDLLPAGVENRDYAGVSGFDWSQFFEYFDGTEFFEALRRSMKRSYDYVLIDSRTGLSDVGDICTVVMPDTMVNCFTMSDQSIDGATMVMRRIAERFSGREIRILPVPTRLDLSAEKERLDIGRATAQAKFDRYLGDLRGEDLERYWRNVEVPYQAYYSYEEILAVFGDPAGAPNTVLSSFERITAEITRGDVTCLPPVPEDDRRRHLLAFQRRPPAPPADVYLSYVPEDRAWADWLAHLIEEAGFRVTSRPPGADVTSEAHTATAEHVRTSEKTVVVLSSAYLRSPEFAAVRETVKMLDPIGNRRLAVPVSVGGPAMTNPFPTRSTADLDQLDEETARRAVLRVLDIDEPPPPSAADVDRPRFPGANPPVWGSLPARNPLFTGRSKILDELRTDLRIGGAVSRAQLLHGLAGVGKTQIALEYAHRFKADYDVVWWVPSEDLTIAQQRLAELARPLGLPASDDETACRVVVDHLRRGEPYKRTLLIFDNVETGRRDDLLELVPAAGWAHVLITARDRDLLAARGRDHVPDVDAVTTDVTAFTREESIELLQRQVSGLAAEECARLADAVGNLPIFVTMAAAWLKETGIPISTYIERLSQEPELVLSEGLAGYPRTIKAVWRATIDQLRQRSPAAVRLLELCAFFGPEPISTSLIYSRAFISAHAVIDPSLGGEQTMIDRLIRDLGRFALARVDLADRSVQIHRLLQALVRDSLPPATQERLRRSVRNILASMRPTDMGPDDPRTWDAYGVIWPHIYGCESDRAGPDEGPARQIMVDRIRFLGLRGQITSGIELAERLWRTWADPSGDDDDIWRLAAGFELGVLLRPRGDIARTIELNREIYEKQVRLLGRDHVHTLRTGLSIGADLRYLGRWSEALEPDREVYEAFSRDYGDDYPLTLRAANSLAVSLRHNGRCYDARELGQHVYERLRDTLGPEHSMTLQCATNLARDYRDCGQFKESRRLLATTVERCRNALGEEAPITLFATRGLAVAERREGRHHEAKERAQRVYGQFVKVFGERSIETLSCQLSLASNDSAMENKPAALQQAMDLQETFSRILGPGHPNTLVCSNNLSIYLRATGDIASAEKLARDTHDQLLAALGPNHPFTLACAVNLANVLADAAKLGEAERLATTTGQSLARTLGALHPDTLACEANRAMILQEAGRRDEARDLRNRTLGLMRQIFDDDHNSPSSLRAGWRINRDLEPHQP